MHESLTSEQILSLAVDKYAIRTTRAWSAREKWLRTGQDQDIAWGEFKGKSKTPVQTMVSLTRPIFSCTCTGRKLPCSHALGLRRLYIDAPHLFPATIPTASASDDWIASLTDAGFGASHINTTSPHITDSQTDSDTARLQRIRKGLDELDMWLGDVVRNGLESVRDKKRTADWQRVARRLVDAQASELASSVRKMATIPGSTPQWPELLLTQMGSLHLLIQGFRNFEDLPAPVQGDLRMAVGWLPKVHAASHTILADRWHVVARQQEVVGKRRRHKIWLWGEESNRPAIIIHMLRNKQKQVESMASGMVLEGSLYFYPSMAPLRAELMGELSFAKDESQPLSPTVIQQPIHPAAGYTDLDEAFQSVNHAFTQNPWLTEFPIMVRSAKVGQNAKASQAVHQEQISNAGILFKTGKTPKPPSWFLTDKSGIRLPLPDKFEYGWHLASLDKSSLDQSGPQPEDGVHLFGIWNREIFTPFTVWQGGRWLSLHILKGEL